MMRYFVSLLLLCLPMIAPANNMFSGPYVGGHFGYLNSEESGYETHNSVVNAFQMTKPKGSMLGFSVGYNKTFNQMLIGAESALDFEKARAHGYQYGSNGNTLGYCCMITSEAHKAFSLGPRAGYILQSNKTLLFITTGFAMSKIKRTFYSDIAVGPVTSQSQLRWQHGWSTGLGMEHFIQKALSIKAEYKYARYGQQEMDTTEVYCCDQTVIEHQKYKKSSAILGLNYYL